MNRPLRKTHHPQRRSMTPPSPIPFLLLAGAAAASDSDATSPPETSVSFRPSVAIVVGIFAVMFTLTFLLLLYAKFCHASATELFGPGLYPVGGAAADPDAQAAAAARYSGIDKTVIESLPFFRFSSLRGSRDGLECAVCLSRFEDAEILRLLPRCKHAFHIACVDRWLEAHSSCPLCRRKVEAAVSLSSSSRSLLRNPSSRRASGDDLELFVEREPSGRRGSSRFGSFREESGEKKSRDEVVLLGAAAEEEDGGGQTPLPLHRLKHRIIVSDAAFKSRWSDVNSSDIMSLNSDMLHAMSSRRLDYRTAPDPRPCVASGGAERVLEIREEMEKKRVLEGKARWMSGSSPVDSGEHSAAASAGSGGGGSLIAAGGRCQSEITNMSRFRAVREPSGSSEDEKVRRVWLPIARRTVQWLAGKERRPPPVPSRRLEVTDV